MPNTHTKKYAIKNPLKVWFQIHVLDVDDQDDTLFIWKPVGQTYKNAQKAQEMLKEYRTMQPQGRFEVVELQQVGYVLTERILKSLLTIEGARKNAQSD